MDGYSELDFYVNILFCGGSCFVDKFEGYLDKILFLFECKEWVDEDFLLLYEFMYYMCYGVVFFLYDDILFVFVIKLLFGDVEKNFILNL